MNSNVNVLNSNIEDISVIDTKKKLDELKQSITNLSDTQKLEKKSEIESTISVIKLELVQLKKDTTIDVSQIQEIEQQLNFLETDYNIFLNGIQTELSGLEQNIHDNHGNEEPIRWDRNKKNVLIGGGILGSGWLISRWFKKRKERETGGGISNNNETKPWYKKRYKRAGIGLVGFLGWRYWGDIKGFFDKLFNGQTKEKDKSGKDLVKILGEDWIYDEKDNSFKYKSKTYTRENLVENKLIATKIDDSGKAVIDIEKTAIAIKEYVDKDTKSLGDKNDLLKTNETKNKYLKLNEIDKRNYNKIGDKVNNFYSKLYKKDGKNIIGAGNNGVDKGFMLFHLDEHFGNIGTLLSQNSFEHFMDATTISMVENIFSFFPKPIISLMLSSAQGMNFIGLDQLAQDTSRLSNKIKSLKPTEELMLRNLCIDIYTQWTAISYYVLAVRNSYYKKVDYDQNKINDFEKNNNILSLSSLSISDAELSESMMVPQVDKKLEKKIEKRDKKEKKLIKKLEETETNEEKKEIIKYLISDIDKVGYKTWTSAFSMIIGHITEKNSYMEYDLISGMYNDYKEGLITDLRSLLDKSPLTNEDIDNIKNKISDFYGTMKSISTQIELRQETDPNGNYFTVWNFPLMKGGKTIYQTFMMYKDNGQRCLVGGTAAVALLSGDLLTWPVRKVFALRKILQGKRPVVRLSPTDRVIRKITNGTFNILGYSLEKAGSTIMRGPLRNISQKVNQVRFSRFMRFRTPESLFKAIELQHIKLKDAATMLANRDSSKLYKTLWGKKWRNLGFSNNINDNMIKILYKNERVFNNFRNQADIKLLSKYRDTKLVNTALYNKYSGDKISSLIQELKKFDLSGGVGKLPNSIKTPSKINRLGNSIADMSLEITNSEKIVNQTTSKIFQDFEKELAKQVKNKKIQIGSDEYKKLSKNIWESAQYGGNKKLKDLISAHNILAVKNEETILKMFNKSNFAQKQKLYNNSDVIKKIVDANGGLAKWKVPGFGRTGRIISIGIHSVMLGWIGSSENKNGKKKSGSELGLEVADFGIGMIPVAGGIYDIGMAFRGKDLNGREMGTGERRIRGSVGLGTGVLDLFTFGLGGTAVRGLVKGGTRIALKTGAKTIAKEGIESGAKIVSKGVSKGLIKQTFKTAGRDILIGTTAGVALIPAIDGIKSIKIFDDPKDESKNDLEVNTSISSKDALIEDDFLDGIDSE